VLLERAGVATPKQAPKRRGGPAAEAGGPAARRPGGGGGAHRLGGEGADVVGGVVAQRRRVAQHRWQLLAQGPRQVLEDGRGGGEQVLQDLRLAVRALVQQPVEPGQGGGGWAVEVGGQPWLATAV
jgi:hypothetical protein